MSEGKPIVTAMDEIDLTKALTLTKIICVMQRRTDVEEKWPDEIKTLWRILHRRAAAQDVNDLWNKKHLRHLILDNSIDHANEHPIHKAFIGGICCTAEQLEESLQMALLTTPCDIPSEITYEEFQKKVFDAMNRVEVQATTSQLTAN